jgi:hypothetical protein
LGVPIFVGYSLLFESRADALRAVAWFEAKGIATTVRQGRRDRHLARDMWWVAYDEVQEDETRYDLVVDEVEQRSDVLRAQLADLGCVDATWGVELSDGPAEEPGPPPAKGFTTYSDRLE